MGTPDFAEASLEKLLSDGFEVCAVFTQPDKARGRGMETGISPVKALALKHDIPVYQPISLRDQLIQEQIRSLKADIIAAIEEALA